MNEVEKICDKHQNATDIRKYWQARARIKFLDYLNDHGEATVEDALKDFDPPPNSRMAAGAVVLKLSKDGKIHCVGYTHSKVVANHSGPRRIWALTRDLK